MSPTSLDALDRAILTALLADGRQSQVELAEHVPLSATAIARRIRTLEERGVICGYQAQISRAALGLCAGDEPVAAIAYDAGFNDLSTFNRRFRRLMGTTPSKYRNDSRAA